ncbi:unnamed protein product [Cochlearia groenlandica]
MELRTMLEGDEKGRRYYGCVSFQVGNDHIWKWWEEAMMQEIDSLSYQIQYNVNIMTRFRERTPLPYVREPVDDVRRLEDELLLTDLELCDLKARVTRQEKNTFDPSSDVFSAIAFSNADFILDFFGLPGGCRTTGGKHFCVFASSGMTIEKSRCMTTVE